MEVSSEDFECSICMERLFDSKILPCGHSFCKECKQNLLQFEDDGSATLNCPRNCSQITTIQKDQIIDDVLPTVFAFEEAFGKIKGRLEQELASCPEEHPENTMLCSRYCQSCRQTFCKSCSENHACECSSYNSIAFDQLQKSFQPICDKHKSFARHLCRECDDAMICIYCKNRRHKGHDVITLDVHIGKIREELTTVLKIAERSVRNFKMPNHEKVFGEFRKKLSEELVVRKIIQVNKYITRLNEEESKILEEFDYHTEAFSSKVAEMTNALDEVEKCLNDQKTAILLLISEQQKLVEKLQSMAKELSFKVDLTDVTADNNLGELQIGQLSNNQSEEQAARNSNINPDLSNEKYSTVSCNIHNERVAETILAGDLREVVRLKSSLLFVPKVENESELLKAAVEGNQSKLLKVILECTNVDIDTKYTENEGMTSLMIAAREGYYDCMKLLIEHNCNINMKDDKGLTALINSSIFGHSECVKLLIERNCDIDMKNDTNGGTAVMYASKSGQTECLKLLLEHNCSVNLQSYTGQTAVICACQFGRSECLKLLLKHNCDINIRKRDGGTALIIASSGGYTECVKLLLEHNNCNIDMKNCNGYTALIWASIRGNSESVKYLLARNCNIDMKDNEGNTSLICACGAGHSECVKLLLKENCNINMKNEVGKTALIIATYGGHTECVKLLLEHNCDVDLKDRYGNTALMWASKSECLTLLKQYAK